MDKFLRKRKHEASSSEDEDRIIDGEIAAEDISICPLPVDNSQPPVKNRMYMDSYLAMGFTWCGDDLTPNPECLVCGEKLSNEAMVPSKLKRHFLSKHSQLSEKHLEYFQGLLIGHEQQMLSFAKKVKISSKAQEASYLVAELIAKQMKPHTIAEKLILPACRIIVKTMIGAQAEQELSKIPLSDNIISRRIHHMSVDIERSVCESFKSSNVYAIQVYESVDIGRKAQLVAFIRYLCDDKIVDQFLCCKELEGSTTGQDIFQTLNHYFSSVGLAWERCVGICTDGAPSMVGSIKGFVTLAKRANKDIISTHCFLHREALVEKHWDFN